MVANKRNTIKRKASDKETEETNAPQQELEETGGDNSEASDYESDKENLLGNIDNDADSSDSEGDEEYVSDDEEALSFESADSDFDEAEIKDVEKAAAAGGDESGEDDDDSAADVNSDSSPEEDNGDESSEVEEDVPEEEEKKETKLDNVKESATKNGTKGEVAESDAHDSDKDAELDDANDDDADADADDDDDDDDDIPKLKKMESVLKKNAVKKVRGVGIFPRKPEVKKGKQLDEYADGDTSDEEDIRNTVGNIPMHWYTDYKHIGYDWDANKIVKAKQGDAIDDFLKRMEDPDFGRTVKDPQTGQNVVLSEEDVALIKRIMAGQNPDAEYDDYGKWIEWFSSEVEQMPIRNIPDSKQSFLPSKGERQRIGKYVHALKMGWMKTKAEKRRLAANSKGPKFYMLWETDHGQEEMRRIHDHVVAPKRPLPHHAESYNPPPEYLFNAQEMDQWKRYEDEPWKRKLHFIPQKFNSLREVPAYNNYIKERFIRCLDLYLCPRGKRTRVTVGPEYLVPKLPSPRDLQPFPTLQNLIYKGHTDMIRTMSVEPLGEYIVTGSDDHTVKIWEISTARCIRTIPTGDIVRSVAWCPNSKISLMAVASGKRVLLINPKVGDHLLVKKTDDLLAEAPRSDTIDNERIQTAVQWGEVTEEERKAGVRVVITHFREVKQVTWHGRGDYFASVMPDAANRSVLIHQLSKRRSQLPFSKSKGLVQCVLFHPVKPCLFVATQRHVRVYDLVRQELLKKLYPGCKWISSMAVHPKGDNLVVGTYEKKLMWFDLDLSTKPYQQLRLHNSAVRNVAFHQRYPLFASASDDRSVIVCHGMVYNDLLQNPLIVPLRRLEQHSRVNDFAVFDVVFHPTQPWVFSSGADSTVRLFT